MQKISLPLDETKISRLRAGDLVTVSGIVYTARDAAHKRLCQLIAQGLPLPFDLTDQVIFYAGPCPAPPGAVIGAVGPTTSGRMDAYTPTLLAHGLKGMLGKGPRSTEVKQAVLQHKAVYFAVTGGVAALLAGCVKSCQLVCWQDLGTEAVYRLQIEDMPAVVALDAFGGDLYGGR